MTLPTDGFGILTYLALIVPGIVFIMVRSQFRGFRDVDRTVGGRLLLAFVVSVVFDVIYLAVFGAAVVERLQTGDPVTPMEVSLAAWMFVATALVIPAIASWVIYGDGKLLRPLHQFAARMKARLTNSRYESTPTAWDLATTSTEATWVRIRIADGVWVGGKFADNSYFSTYPEPRDIFIEKQYTLTEDGDFVAAVEGSAGVWVAVRDDYQVEWLYDAEE